MVSETGTLPRAPLPTPRETATAAGFVNDAVALERAAKYLSPAAASEARAIARALNVAAYTVGNPPRQGIA